MRFQTKSSVWTVAAVAIAASVAATLNGSAASPKFYDDDPVPVERATQDASRMAADEVNLFVDLAYNVLTGGRAIASARAQNINTIDEVPDSSWFTNRIGARPLTVADVATGPDTTTGPASGAWTVTSSKSDGVTPGFTIKDASGQRWFLKFDPPGHRAMATGTEVAVTKLMWALGYNVPENHIAYLRREQLLVGAEATFTPPAGRKRPMRRDDIDRLLARADREADGSYRVVASKALDGRPIGRIRFTGVRPDDPNDVVAHENRRELRGYGVFAAWLNHVDAKAINSLDTLVSENGHAYVRHHIIDFGSALGSGGVGAADYSAGREYLVEPKLVAKQMIGFGFAAAAWHREPFYEAPSIGRLATAQSTFDPEQWKPRVPNQAFLHARADDKFWAARKLMALSTEMLRAAVRAGDFDDRASEEFLVTALAQRRNAIGRAYLTAVNPIVDPAIDADGVLTFGNAAVDSDVAHAPDGYQAIWSAFDNATRGTRRIAETGGRTAAMPVPDGLPRTEGAFIPVELSATGAAPGSWHRPVHAYFRLLQGTWRLVGFERMPEA
jgi:hypothetical protein